MILVTGANMETVFRELLILLVVVWTAAVILRKLGLPTIMGELLAGVIIGPAVLGLVYPNEVIEVLAQMGVFFLMLHAGVETHPREFLSALKQSVGVAVAGALVPFSVATGIALGFGLALPSAIFVGLVMTATAVIVTLKILRDLGLQNTRMARVIVASCVIDDLLTLVMFSFVLGFMRDGNFDIAQVLITAAKVFLFFGISLAIGYFGYPMLARLFDDRHGKGFTFVLVLGLAWGLFAEAIGLHIIMGAYLAGLFFDQRVASVQQQQKVEDRLNGIAYSFLGPIFFVSLGFNVSLGVLQGPGVWFVLALTAACFVGQVVSSGGMARLIGFNWTEALTVGVGMSGRAEMAFILAALGLSMGLLTPEVFSVLIFTAFSLNLITPIGLKLCAMKMGIGRRIGHAGE